MQANLISIASISQPSGMVKQPVKQQLPNLKTGPDADTFNGKTLEATGEVPAKKSFTTLAIEFLGKKKTRPNYNSSRKGRSNGSRSRNTDNRSGSTRTRTDSSKTKTPVPVEVAEYRNIFDKLLVATPNPNLRSELSKDRKVVDLDLAVSRISSLSRYLKEDMVGFIMPNGEQWFPPALENFIYGSRAKRVQVSQFKDSAKELWSLIAKADPYWTSPDFIKYLESMPQSDAVKATTQAIKEIQIERKPFSSAISFGYKSKMKDIKKLLDDGCAYTGVPMVRNGRDQTRTVSAEHIFPHSKGGSDSDDNFLLAAAKPNNERGNMPLVDYLRGNTD